ncbi:hypothetical protein DM01DRAFT_1404739 [Hesseltinella vesiculosa]|uniref:Uncharacterized protein n=1 Tax=Hesseltinella vesiculosa TaxID=101127 RepID=A0A1X2GSM0_9FUNG|nr:hypothetical protein DM01DRAFT_1404739 [Hesseltinella vesiculosa]
MEGQMPKEKPKLPTWMFPYPEIQPHERKRVIHGLHSYTRKWCACMSLRGGSTLSCLIWMALNLYPCILAFQGRSPIFSHIDSTALTIQGVVCLIFTLIAAYCLFALFVNQPGMLGVAHRSMWCIVVVFLVDFFVNIVLYGVQQDQFQDWCVGKSRSAISNEIQGNASTIVFTPHYGGSDLYNCTRLWQDEVKFSVIIFLMVSFCYVYWATCLWSYEQKIVHLFSLELQQGALEEARRAANFNSLMGMGPHPGMMNMVPSQSAHDHTMMNEASGSAMPSRHHPSDDNQRSLAQITGEAFSNLMSRLRP